jgi:hypothetical protein
MREVLFIALVLACPLMMIWMMRGGHGHGGHASHDGGVHGGHHDGTDAKDVSTQDLRRQRDELERRIEEREQSESGRELEPTGWGRQ